MLKNEATVRGGAAAVAVSLLVGRQGINATVQLIPIDVTFEKGFYAGRSLTLYGAAGPTTTVVQVDVLASPQGAPEQTLHANLYGAVARVGGDLLLTPDIGLRLEAIARLHFGDASYRASDDDPVLNGFDGRGDQFGQIGGNFVSTGCSESSRGARCRAARTKHATTNRQRFSARARSRSSFPTRIAIVPSGVRLPRRPRLRLGRLGRARIRIP